MLAFKGLENAVSFGQPTAGYATANAVYDFPDSSSLMLTIAQDRSEEHTSELQSRGHLVCRLLLEKKKNNLCNLIKIALHRYYRRDQAIFRCHRRLSQVC